MAIMANAATAGKSGNNQDPSIQHDGLTCQVPKCSYKFNIPFSSVGGIVVGYPCFLLL